MDPRFAIRRTEMNQLYSVTLRFVNRCIGGIPAVNIDADDDSPAADKAETKTKDLMSSWLSKNLADKLSPEEITALADRTFDEAYRDAEEQASTTFKADDTGLYLEGRQLKAMLKEAGSRIGMGKLKLKSALHEALHVDEDVVYLTRGGAVLIEPDGYETRPIHVMTAQGPRTSIKKTAYVTQAEVTFTVRVLRDCGVTEKHLVDILAFAQDLGLGADRSQGNGKFEVVAFAPVGAAQSEAA
jgi:hypothetical protein